MKKWSDYKLLDCKAIEIENLQGENENCLEI